MTLSQRYEIGSLIGRDGDVWLYRARERTTGSAVTLRILAGEVAARPEARLRFLQLAALQARLRHPNIERVLDIGEETEGPYAAVEEVAGAGLGAVVAARGPLPAAHVADIVRAIADALDYLHDRGLVHGALRPEVVLIDRS
ncbi:MAG: protein kinase, partial [Dehalococcoidia bacterium]